MANSLVLGNFLKPYYPAFESEDSPINQFREGYGFTHNDLSSKGKIFSTIQFQDLTINDDRTEYFLTFGEVKSVNSSSIDINVEAEFTFGNFRGGVSFDYNNTNINRSFTLVLSRYHRTSRHLINENPEFIDTRAKELYEANKEHFKTQYGDSFVSGFTKGYYVNVVLSFSLVESEVYSELSSYLNAEGGCLTCSGSLDAKFEKIVENSMRNGNVKVTSYSRGCTSPQLSELNKSVINAINTGGNLNMIISNFTGILNNYGIEVTVLGYYAKSLKALFPDIDEPTLDITMRTLKTKFLLSNYLKAESLMNDLTQTKDIFGNYAGLPIKLSREEKSALTNDIREIKKYLVKIIKQYNQLKKCVEEDCFEQIVVEDVPESEFKNLIEDNDSRQFTMSACSKFDTNKQPYTICEYTFNNMIFKRAYLEFNNKIVLEKDLGPFSFNDVILEEDMFHEALMKFIRIDVDIFRSTVRWGILNFIGIDLWGKLHTRSILHLQYEVPGDGSVRFNYTGSLPESKARSKEVPGFWTNYACE